MSANNLSTTITTTTNDQIGLIQKQINLYYPIILSLFSTFGNLISFSIFCTNIFRNNGSCFFLKQKAIIDTLNVYIGTWRYTYLAIRGIDLKNTSYFMCYFLSIGVYTFDPFASWLNVFISLDRLFLVLRPSIYKSTPREILKYFQIILILVSFTLIIFINLTLRLFYTTYNSSATIVSKPKPNTTESILVITSYTCVTQIGNTSWSDLINITITLIVPFFSMATSSIIIVYKLVESKSRINKYKNQNGFTKKNISIIKCVLCLDLAFLVFNIPRFIMQIFKISTVAGTFILTLTTVLKYSYYSVTLFIYISTNNLFRAKFKELLFGLFRKERFKVFWTLK
jgi:hypothetical protein